MDKILVIDDSAVQAEFLRSILRDDYDVSMWVLTRALMMTGLKGLAT